ncbi:MAG: helix-turn-helix transcriptional regulator [Acholeplasmataceae bacterium]|nr:helix-turn-helix transcriptional regulator [Acholeplasmataceae bacterium]
MKSKELTNYLERLRAARNISQESFTLGITSLRQYRRYLSGESDIPFQIIDKLCERLGVQTINLIRELETARTDESKEVDTFYNAVVYNNHLEVERLRKVLDHRAFIDNENRLVYQHSVTLYDFMNQRMTVEVAADLTKKLIGFNKISKQSIFTLTEMFILTSLLDLDPVAADKEMISSRLKEILNDSSIVLGSSVNYAYQIIIFRLAKYSGSNKSYSDVINYCKLGIKHGMSLMNFYLLEYFYYYAALAYYRIGDIANYESMLMKCFVALHLDDNEKKIEKFTQMINRDFNINFPEFVIEHYRLKHKNDSK